MAAAENARADVAAGMVVSFAAQALRYFDRPHESVARAPIASPAAWRGEELAGRDDFVFELSRAQLRELEQASRRVLARVGALEVGSQGRRALAGLRRDDFPLPGLEQAIAGWRRELAYGRGLLVVRGLPVERWGDDLCACAYWGLGLHLGAPGAQNPQGDLLGDVRDTGEDASDPFVRRYRTSGDIAYHCDLADVVGLLCLRRAARGGESRVASSVAVYNALLARAPERVGRLYEPFLLDSRNEEKDGRRPYLPVPPCRHAGGVLRTFYHSDYFRSVARHPGVGALAPDDLALLDLYDEVASSEALRLDMTLEVGDIQLLSNHFVVHARRAYRDAHDPRERRHLLRLWLSLRNDEAATGHPGSA